MELMTSPHALTCCGLALILPDLSEVMATLACADVPCQVLSIVALSVDPSSVSSLTNDALAVFNALVNWPLKPARDL